MKRFHICRYNLVNCKYALEIRTNATYQFERQNKMTKIVSYFGRVSGTHVHTTFVQARIDFDVKIYIT